MNGHLLAYMPDMELMKSIRTGENYEFTARKLWDLN